MITDEFGQVPFIDFTDMDRDAMIDLIFFANGTVYQFYNKFEANGPSSSSLCKSSYETSYFKDNKIFDEIVGYNLSEGNVVRQVFQKDAYLYNSSIGIKGRMRFGDLGADGYPDMIMTMKTHSGNTLNTSLYENY